MKDISIKLGDLNVKLLEGEYHRFHKEDGSKDYFYLCPGLVGENKLLFQYVDTLYQPVDFVQAVIDNLPTVAIEYLVDVLNTHKNVLVFISHVPGSITCFDIYYGNTCKSNATSDLLDWMMDHNDWAARQYNYTEIIDGKQCPAGGR